MIEYATTARLKIWGPFLPGLIYLRRHFLNPSEAGPNLNLSSLAPQERSVMSPLLDRIDTRGF